MRNIDDEIEKTLHSLQGADRASAPKGFDRAISQRLSFLPESTTWLKRLRLGVAAMVLLGLTNIIALYSLAQDSSGDLDNGLVEEFYDSSSYFFESANNNSQW